MRDVVTTPERRRQFETAGLWTDVTLLSAFRRHAASTPDRTAVVDEAGARRHTFGDLGRDARKLAGWMRCVGVGTGHVVSMQLPNVYEAVVTALAIQMVGGIINPLLPSYRAKELAFVFAKAGTKLVVTPDVYRKFDHHEMVDRLRAGDFPQVRHLVLGAARSGSTAFADALASAEPLRDPGAPDPAAVSEVIFSSGTEAQPKAVMHTEHTTSFAVENARRWLGLTDDDVVLMPSPVGHSTGFNYGLRLAMHHGLKLVLQDAWDPVVAAQLVESERCTYTLAASTFLQDLTTLLRTEGRRLPTLKYFGCGGAPIPADLVAAADEVGIAVQRLYGSTEMLSATWHPPGADLKRRMYSDGMPMTHNEIEVRRDDGSVCDIGEAGEIYARSPGTAVGYFDDPERTAATFAADGWVASGDVGVLEGSGDLRVVGRKKEIIIRGGLNIAPQEVEELLLSFPEVRRAAIVGVPDDRMGERCCAVVVLADGTALDMDTMVQRLRATGLANYKLPERLEIVGELPMTPSGKVQKHVIVKRLLADVSD